MRASVRFSHLHKTKRCFYLFNIQQNVEYYLQIAHLCKTNNIALVLSGAVFTSNTRSCGI